MGICILAVVTGATAAIAADLSSSARNGFIWSLPAPGPLIPPQSDDVMVASQSAAAAAQRGLAAVNAQQWKDAAAAFEQSRHNSSCIPPVILDLAKAHEKADMPVTAALWYREYLSMIPDAANAADIRKEIARLADKTETMALRDFDMAERLADALSAEAMPGAKSLRQAALEDIARYAYLVDMTDRADGIIARIRSLPNVAPLGTRLDVVRSGHGLSAAMVARDLSRAEMIQKRWGDAIDPKLKLGDMAQLYARRGDLQSAHRLLDGVSADKLTQVNFVFTTIDYLDKFGDFDFTAKLVGRMLDSGLSHGFVYAPYGFAVREMESAFWNGHTDSARSLAKQLRVQFEKYDVGLDMAGAMPEYLLTLAVLGDDKAIATYLRRISVHLDPDSKIFERISLAAAASLPGDRAAATIDLVAFEKASRDRKIAVNGWSTEETMERAYPLAYFAKQTATGRDGAAMNWLINRYSEKPTDHEADWPSALQFAVATGRMTLAFLIADHLSTSDNILRPLNHLTQKKMLLPTFERGLRITRHDSAKGGAQRAAIRHARYGGAAISPRW